LLVRFQACRCPKAAIRRRAALCSPNRAAETKFFNDFSRARMHVRLPSTLNLAWDAWLNSEYWFNRFSIWLPPGASLTDQFRLRMQLLHWRWKITDLDLPEKLSDQIAKELAKKNP
jgi:hypothetical protein